MGKTKPSITENNANNNKSHKTTNPAKDSSAAAKEAKEKSHEIDPNKRFTDGHKFFTASESAGFAELLHTEARTRDRYARMKDSMVLPRNPLNGSATPRDVHAMPVLNPQRFEDIVGGIPLFSDTHSDFDFTQTAMYKRTIKNQAKGKIGVDQDKYEILGNTKEENAAAQPTDLFMLTRDTAARKSSKIEQQRAITESIRKEKAKRQEQQLSRELIVLQQTLQSKGNQLSTLKSTLQMS